MGDSSYKGVSASQDSRFSNKESALLRKLSFPPHFSVKVDMTKVELSVIKPWISRRITELLGFEDDVVPEYAVGMLEEERFPDARKVQIQLMGFLESKTAEFMGELWELLVSAQESPGGVPRRFVEEKKEELRLKKEEGERVVREARERAARAAEGTERRRASRWDTGERDTRPPAYRPTGRDEYRPRRDDHRRRDDHNANAGRSRDAGWGSRAPRTPADSRYASRRSPSPPPHRRRSPSLARSPPPPPRSRPRSRSRSVTPDYRATLRDRKQHRTSHATRHDREESTPSASRRDEHESQREQELRDRLMRAKASSRHDE